MPQTAIFCPECGSKPVLSAAYCHICGRQLDSEESRPAQLSDEPVFEICTVHAYVTRNSLVPFKKRTWQWFAEGLGPEGSYVVAASRAFVAVAGNQNTGPLTASGNPPIESEAARTDLISELLRKGWEPLDARGREFRRLAVT